MTALLTNGSMMKNRILPSVLVLAVTLWTSVGSLGATVEKAQPAPSPAPASAPSVVKPAAAPAATRDVTKETLKRMTEEVDLDAEQQKKVQKVLESHEKRMRDLRNDKTVSPQEFGMLGREARFENDKQLKAILTPEQYEKWQRVLAQRTPSRRRVEQPAAGSGAGTAQPPSSPSAAPSAGGAKPAEPAKK